MRGRSVQNVGKRTLLAKTCLTCLEFKDASHFRRRANGYYVVYCRSCDGKTTKAIVIGANSESMLTATNQRNPWTESDIIQLRDLVTAGLSYKEIASKMGRTIYAITAAKHLYVE